MKLSSLKLVSLQSAAKIIGVTRQRLSQYMSENAFDIDYAIVDGSGARVMTEAEAHRIKALRQKNLDEWQVKKAAGKTRRSRGGRYAIFRGRGIK